MPFHVFLSGFALVLAVTVFAVNLFTQDNTPRTELATFGSEVDFANPEIVAHTAADGIAVIGGTASGQPLAAQPVRLTSDLSTIWEGETSSTHGGFTLPVAMDGESIGVLTIPDIGLSVRVYEAENEMEAMEKGLAHFRHTSAWEGNTGLSGHNVNFDGSPGYFLNLYRLRPGAVIRYETAHGMREYAVETIREIPETDWSMLGRTEDNRVTLITCITGKPALRLVVQAVETFS
ncbi:MAG: sortase [Oscillospiraceae bacterium]|nr:sortase [Oscillospiraceae bacterium]